MYMCTSASDMTVSAICNNVYCIIVYFADFFLHNYDLM